MSEADQIIQWLRGCIAEHEKHADTKGQIVARRHHIDACRNIILGIECDQHLAANPLTTQGAPHE